MTELEILFPRGRCVAELGSDVAWAVLAHDSGAVLLGIPTEPHRDHWIEEPEAVLALLDSGVPAGGPVPEVSRVPAPVLSAAGPAPRRPDPNRPKADPSLYHRQLKDGSNPKDAFGRAKPSLRFIPPAALIPMAMAMEDGADKYGMFNWRKDPVSISTYYDAALRHLLEFWDGHDHTADTRVHQLGAVMACCGIILDAMAQGVLIDDRTPFAGQFGELCDQHKTGEDYAFRG